MINSSPARDAKITLLLLDIKNELGKTNLVEFTVEWSEKDLAYTLTTVFKK